MKNLYRVNFLGRLNDSKAQPADLTKTYVSEIPLKRDEIIQKVYETHELFRILKITDLSKAAIFNEVVS